MYWMISTYVNGSETHHWKIHVPVTVRDGWWSGHMVCRTVLLLHGQLHTSHDIIKSSQNEVVGHD